MRKENSTNSINERILINKCDAFKTLQLFKGRWKLSILLLLNERAFYYSEFKDFLVEISDRILSQQLNELIQNNLIEKKKSSNNVLYRLTRKGDDIIPILLKLSEFSRNAK